MCHSPGQLSLSSTRHGAVCRLDGLSSFSLFDRRPASVPYPFDAERQRFSRVCSPSATFEMSDAKKVSGASLVTGFQATHVPMAGDSLRNCPVVCVCGLQDKFAVNVERRRWDVQEYERKAVEDARKKAAETGQSNRLTDRPRRAALRCPRRHRVMLLTALCLLCCVLDRRSRTSQDLPPRSRVDSTVSGRHVG